MKKNINQFLIFFSILVIGLSADFRDTPAGTILFSTNTTMQYSNIANWQYTNWGTNNFSNVVLAIYGFTNNGSLFVGTTQSNFPAQPAYYYYNFTNEGNTNTAYNFTFVTNWISNYDGIYPILGLNDWQIDLTCITNSNVTLTTWQDTIITNVPEDAGYGFYVRIRPPANAVNRTGIDIYITNIIDDLRTNGIYQGTNAYSYGGTNLFNDKITFRIRAPDVKLWKTMEVTNLTGAANSGLQDVIPGSIITYTIHFTNKGDMAAQGLFFTETIPNDGSGNNYVSYITNSILTTGVAPDATNFSDDNCSTWVHNVSATDGASDQDVDGFKFSFGVGGLGLHEGGTISYKVVVK